jgi:hypothetical protein
MAEDLGGAGTALEERDEVIRIVGEPIPTRSVARFAVSAEVGRVDMPSLRELAHEVRQVLPTRAPTVQEHDGRACSRFRVVE